MIKAGKTNRLLRLMKYPWTTELWNSAAGHRLVLFRIYTLLLEMSCTSCPVQNLYIVSLDNMGSLLGYVSASPITVSVPLTTGFFHSIQSTLPSTIR